MSPRIVEADIQSSVSGENSMNHHLDLRFDPHNTDLSRQMRLGVALCRLPFCDSSTANDNMASPMVHELHHRCQNDLSVES